MKLHAPNRALVLALPAFVLALLAACATDAATEVAPEPDNSTVVQPEDAGVTEASDDASDASACSDCEYFVDRCEDADLCISELFASGGDATKLDSRMHVLGVTGRGDADVWLAGSGGGIGRFDGATWHVVSRQTQENIFGLWLRDGHELAFTTPLALYARGLPDVTDPEEHGWAPYGNVTQQSSWSSIRPVLRTTWARPGSSSIWLGVYAASWQGSVWRLRDGGEGNFTLENVLANKCNRYGWLCQETLGIHGASAGDVWAVGTRGNVIHVTDAESDTPVVSAVESHAMVALNAVHALSATEVWAVGTAGTVRKYDPSAGTFEPVDAIDTHVDLYSVTATSPSDVWIAGTDGTVHRYDGQGWRRVRLAGLGKRRPTFTSAWTSPSGDVWIAGEGVIVTTRGKS